MFRKTGNYLHEKLTELATERGAAREVRGRGFIQGLELEVPARPIVEQALAEGILMNSTKDMVIRFFAAVSARGKARR